MQNDIEKYEQLKEYLTCEDLSLVLRYALSHWNLAKLVNKLNLNQKDVKTSKIQTNDLSDILARGAFSNPARFMEIGEALNLYSKEARDAIKNALLEEYKESLIQEKDRIKKINTARLVWALLTNPSKDKRLYGRSLIDELDENRKKVFINNTDMEDGERIKSSGKAEKKKKREETLKKQSRDSVIFKVKQQGRKLKNEIESLKKERSRLLEQIKSKKDSETMKDLEKKLKRMEKERVETKEKINKEYILKDQFEALKKENERLYQLYISEKSINKSGSTVRSHSLLSRFLSRLNHLPIGRSFFWNNKRCRVGIFVDVQNMFYSAKNLFHGRLDFEKFLQIALRGRRLIRATAYIVKTPEIDQSKFISLLKNNDYVVKTLDLKTGMNGFAKGNWDVGMVMDIFELADQLDVIVLASGDGDFVPLVKYLQKRGIRVEVYGFAYNTAIDLKECADIFIPIQEDVLIKDSRGVVKQH